MYETEWETPINPVDLDTCEECGGDSNDDGCESWCIWFKK
jgi:hypothetical protein